MAHMNVGVVSYLIGALANLLLTILITVSWRGHPKGRWLIAACTVTTIWAAGLAVQEGSKALPANLVWGLEVMHQYIWLLFFSQLLHRGAHPKTLGHTQGIRFGIHLCAWGLFGYLGLISLFGKVYPDIFNHTYQFYGHMGLAIIGLVLIEQFYRNSRLDQRWRIKFICFALGVLFVYEFCLYSDARMFRHIHKELWEARGAVAALLTPFIAVSAARNPEWSVDIFISRQIVFQSAALLGSGTYLLLMAVAGYYIKYYGGEWGAVLQIVFLVGAFMLLTLVLFSGQIRAKVRVFLNKNFFSNAYDYRQELLRLIATLSRGDTGLSLGERVILALGQVVESPSGLLWEAEPSGRLSLKASYGDPDIGISQIETSDPLLDFIRRTRWVINLEEMLIRPDMYGGLKCPEWLRPYDNAWLLIPLWSQEDTLDHLVLLTKPRTFISWNWEAIDMLKNTGCLAASYLALEQAAGELSEARQFEGFNRVSAFVIHDLKNLIAQLSLVVRNAEKHRDNPEFMRDAITTVDHAVGRMNVLMSQLRNSNPAAASEVFDLAPLLREVADARSKQAPPPQCELGRRRHLWVRANRDRLGSALEHVIHNAQDAAGKHGQVSVRMIDPQSGYALVEVEDNGCGMDEAFIRGRLFKPFDTTKGLTGMGIGAYESREYIRGLGGDLQVKSVPGQGSQFLFKIPLAEEESGSSEPLSRSDTQAV